MAQGSEPLRRAAAVMDLVACSGGLTVSEISAALELPVPTAHRLVASLVDVGYLSGGGRGSRYNLGPRFFRQLHFNLTPGTLEEIVAPLLQPLADEFQETVFMARLRGDGISLGAAIFPRHSIRTLIHPGHVFPVHATSAGKVICAHRSGAFIERALGRSLESFRPNTITVAKVLREQYALIRRQGYATIDDELDEGVFALSCPVWYGTEVLYSVGVVGIRERLLNAWPVERLVEVLTGTALELGPLLRVAVPRRIAATT